jgi:hypothetical protein
MRGVESHSGDGEQREDQRQRDGRAYPVHVAALDRSVLPDPLLESAEEPGGCCVWT